VFREPSAYEIAADQIAIGELFGPTIYHSALILSFLYYPTRDSRIDPASGKSAWMDNKPQSDSHRILLLLGDC
jgi:hypothetical protein